MITGQGYSQFTKITNLINDLEIKEEYKAKMLFLIDQGEWQNIFVIISKINPYYTKKLLNPLQYLGVQRNKRMLKLEEKQSFLYKYYDVTSDAMLSETLKKSMQLQN